MQHVFSRAAFNSGRSSANLLLSLYCSLVVIELALKDNQTPWRQGHAISEWLSELSDAGLTSSTQQLSTCMQLLWCTDRRGNTSCVSVDAYPDLRYLLHDSDSPGHSTDHDLGLCLALIQDIETVLHQRGIL